MTRRAPKQVFASRMGEHPALVEKLLDLVGTIPTPRETKSDQPQARARTLARSAATRAAATAGTLALPPGPLGWLTIAPELYAVWKVQAQLVADIAGAYGRRDLLTREQMLYCLFGHTAAKAFHGLIVRVGERYVVRRAPLSALYAIANKIAIRIAQRSAGRLVTRWIPALGAIGVAGYVYIDTGRVADTARDLFAADVLIEGELEVEGAEMLAEAEGAAEPKRKQAAAGKSTAKKAAATKPAAKKTSAKKATGKKSTAKKATTS